MQDYRCFTGEYGGNAFSDDLGTIKDTTSAAVAASKQRFMVSVNTYDATTAVTGFSLVYNQTPC